MPLTQSLAARLATQLESLPLALRGASTEELRARPMSGKWSAHENLAHLVRHHDATLFRIGRILKEDRPTLPSYSAEQDADFPALTQKSTDEVLRRLMAARKEIIALVAQLTPEQWSRTGIHPLFGPMTVAEWLDFFLLHEAHHLYVIMRRARGRE